MKSSDSIEITSVELCICFHSNMHAPLLGLSTLKQPGLSQSHHFECALVFVLMRIHVPKVCLCSFDPQKSHCNSLITV